MAVPDDVVSAVKDAATSVRVADLLGVALKRKGGHFKGRCPLPVHPKEQGRFAKHADGRVEYAEKEHATP